MPALWISISTALLITDPEHTNAAPPAFGSGVIAAVEAPAQEQRGAQRGIAGTNWADAEMQNPHNA